MKGVMLSVVILGRIISQFQHRSFQVLLPCLLSCCCMKSLAQAVMPAGLQIVEGHPRLLMTEGDKERIGQSIREDRFWQQADSLLMRAAHDVLPMPMPQRIVTGRRLLDVSRETLRRVLLLGYAYRMTDDMRFFKRAERELLAVAAFSDWNPSHYLDVAEMTTAVAVGYDWFYNLMDESTRATLRQALIDKGLMPSFDSRYNDWLERENNWNQVCNTGMAYGAMAIYEEAPVLADSIIRRAFGSIQKPMKNYGPDGAYPEGYSYWGFGTTYNVMFIDALERCYGSDFGLSWQKGFLKSAGFILHIMAPDRDSFNYGDNKGTGRMSPAMFWLARRNHDLSLLWNERILFDAGSKTKLTDYRFFTLAMLWGAGIDMGALPQPHEKVWASPSAVTPVAMMRTSWDDQKAIYLAFKGGSARSSHAHLDAGSFVMVANGERWAMDFGRQDYNSLESAGLDIWNKEQTSDRWRVFRYNNLAHNTLTFDRQLQRVDGYVGIACVFPDPDSLTVSADLTPVYAGQVESVKRQVSIVNERYVLVSDHVGNKGQATSMRWTMLTPAKAKVKRKNKIILTQNGKRLTLQVEAPTKIKMKTWSTAPATSYDAANPGTVLVGFETVLPPDSHYTFNIKLTPEP